jgi:hypothetical protein
MRPIILSALLLGTVALHPMEAAVILGGTTIDPSFSTNVVIITDFAFNPIGVNLIGTNVLINTGTLEAALLVEEGTPDASELATSFDFSQFVALTVDLGSFTGSTINAYGTPLTPVTNTALTGILGLNVLQLNFIGALPGPNDGALAIYDVISLTQVPEPATIGLSASALIVFLIRRKLAATSRQQIRCVKS